MSTVSIIDYGIGNLLSVARAFEYHHADVKFVNTPEEILSSDRLVLPGVGAFADGMSGLSSRGFIDSIQSYVAKGNPFIGICLGMQMMLSKSFEFGEHSGLNLIEGEVVSIPKVGIDGNPHKIPHIGWNELIPVEDGAEWESSILNSTPERSSVYFVHSYMAKPRDPKMRLADTVYNGQVISAAIQHDNVYGCQFHPEKSGQTGLDIIQQFLKI